MGVLSIFIDESGDFDVKSHHSPYYLYTLVFHDQERPIDNNVEHLEQRLDYYYNPEDAIHSAPLIRREYEYQNMSIDERRRIFIDMYHFTRKCDILYKTFYYKKIDFDDKFALEARMARDLKLFLDENLSFFHSYESIIVYYDNGQVEITKMLNTMLHAILFNVDFRRVLPIDKRLFQAADFICTMELLDLKRINEGYSKSEKQFFYRSKEPFKPYIKTIKKKSF